MLASLLALHDNCHVVMIGDRYQKDQKGDNTVFIGYGVCIQITRNAVSNGGCSHILQNFNEF